MTPPTMAGWNLALRFGLELAAIAGLTAGAWRLTSGPMRWIALAAVPVGVAVVWGTFNVVGDPSRSGGAPVEVAGAVRLAIELAILGGASAVLVVAGRSGLGIGLGSLILLHYAASTPRIEWMLNS